MNMDDETVKLEDGTFEELKQQYGDPWGSPILFDDELTPDIPVNVLPSVFKEYAESLAFSTEVPEGMVVMTMLGVISAAVSKQFVISPYKDWKEPINIYTLIAMPPANQKSLILKRCLQPIIEWEKEQRKQCEKDYKYQLSRYKSDECYIEGLRRKLAKSPNEEQRLQLSLEIADKESKLQKPSMWPIIFANDITPESLAHTTYEQNGKFAIFSDEGGIIEILSGLYQKGQSNIDILLKGIDGGDVRVHRKSIVYHLNPYLTVTLIVQPAVVTKMASKYAFNGNGLLERFLYVFPPSKVGFRKFPRIDTPDYLCHSYEKKVKMLLDTSYSLAKSGITMTLTLTESALHNWQLFRASLEKDLAPQGELAYCQGWCGKLPGFTLRLAGLLHLAGGNEQQTRISESVMNQALLLSNLLIQHAIVAYNKMAIDQAREDAKYIFQWMVEGKKPAYTKSDLVYALRNKKMGKPERINKAIEILIERNLMRIECLPTRKPTLILQLNPVLYVNN